MAGAAPLLCVPFPAMVLAVVVPWSRLSSSAMSRHTNMQQQGSVNSQLRAGAKATLCGHIMGSWVTLFHTHGSRDNMGHTLRARGPWDHPLWAHCVITWVTPQRAIQTGHTLRAHRVVAWVRQVSSTGDASRGHSQAGERDISRGHVQPSPLWPPCGPLPSCLQQAVRQACRQADAPILIHQVKAAVIQEHGVRPPTHVQLRLQHQGREGQGGGGSHSGKSRCAGGNWGPVTSPRAGSSSGSSSKSGSNRVAVAEWQ